MLNRLKSMQSQGRLEAAEAIFKRILEHAPRHLHSWLGLSYCASLKGNMDYAVHAVETAVALQPIDEDEISDCITALSHFGRRDAARALLDMQPKNRRFQIALGILEEKQGRYEEALAYYTSAHELDPKAELPLHKLISLHRRSGDFAVAQSMVDRLSALDKRHEPAAWHLRAQIHRAAGDRVAAIATWQRGLQLAPYFEASVIDLARELRQQRKLDEAHAVLSRYPPTYGLLLALSDLELGRRDHEAALRHTTAAQALEPRKPDALVRAVRIEADRRGYAAALARVDQIDALGPEYHVTALRSRTDILRANGEHQEVLRLLKEMATIHPADAPIMMDLARQYRAVGDRAAAQGTIAIALEREPDNVTVLAEAGHFANAQDDRVTALRYFRRIMEIAPDQVGHYIRLASHLYDLGQSQEAREIYEAAEVRFGRSVEIWGEQIRILRETGELYRARDEARQAHAAYPANFSRWSDRFDLELKLSAIDDVKDCLAQAPAQSRGEEVHVLVARARVALRAHDTRQAIMFLEKALHLESNNRGVLGQLFRQHVKAFNVEQAAACHARSAALAVSDRRIRGMATNASQSHDGQLLNDLLIDRKAGTDLRSTKVLPHSSRVPVLLQLVLQRPDHIPTATMLLVTLREGNCFGLSTGTSNASVSIIPKRIGQFWDDPDPPDDLLELSKTWRDLNPDHGYVLFNNVTAQTYLTAHFPPAVGIAYRRCCDATTKADLFRLAFLSLEGGIWADMDDRCIVPLTSIIPNRAEALFWQESTGHLCNNFMAAKPGHPILQQAFVTAVNAINRGDRDKVWMLTGPGLLSRAFAVAMAQAGDQWRDWLDRIVVLDEFEIWSLVAIHCRTSHKRLGKHWLKLAFPQTGQRPAMAATQHLIQT